MKLSNSSIRRMRLLSVVGGLLASSTIALLPAASAAPGTTTVAPPAGPIAVLATIAGGPRPGKIVVAGAIGDWGTALTIDKNGKPDQNGNYVRVTLRKGGFEIDSTALNEKTSNPRPQVASDATCSASASGSAPVTIFNGTGLYKGITGTARLTLTFTGVGRRYPSGPKKGQCSHSESGQPLAMLGSVIGRGTVHYG